MRITINHRLTMGTQKTDFPGIVCITNTFPIYMLRDNDKITARAELSKRQLYIPVDASTTVINGNVIEVDYVDNKEKSTPAQKSPLNVHYSSTKEKAKSQSSKSQSPISPKKAKKRKSGEDSDPDYEDAGPAKRTKHENHLTAKSEEKDGETSDDESLGEKYGDPHWHSRVSQFTVLRPEDFSKSKTFNSNGNHCKIYCYNDKWYVSMNEFKKITKSRFGLKNIMDKYNVDQLLSNKYLYRFKAIKEPGGPSIMISIDILANCIPGNMSTAIKTAKEMQTFVTIDD